MMWSVIPLLLLSVSAFSVEECIEASELEKNCMTQMCKVTREVPKDREDLVKLRKTYNYPSYGIYQNPIVGSYKKELDAMTVDKLIQISVDDPSQIYNFFDLMRVLYVQTAYRHAMNLKDCNRPLAMSLNTKIFQGLDASEKKGLTLMALKSQSEKACQI